MAGARHFEELECWQLARELKVALYAVVNRPAVKNDLHYRSQVCDAAASAPRNIAEGFGRRTNTDFCRFLDIARASLMECQNHIIDGFDRRYVSANERDI